MENITSAEYLKKKNQVFYIDEENSTKTMKNVDFTMFKVFDENGYFEKDKNNVYYLRREINKVNPNNFEIIEDRIKYNNEIYEIDENMNLIKIEDLKLKLLLT